MSMSSVSDPLVGHVLGARYEITGRIARGGMATVYLATDTRLSRDVALKLMHETYAADADFLRRFDREARAAAQLSQQPNIVSVFDQGRDHGRPYIVMEYVEGSTLRNLISREAPLPPLRAVELMEPVLAALASAHAHGIVHRDVKPENVLISTRGQVKVADFGLAKGLTSNSVTANAGSVMGTVSYIPPEVVQKGHADARSDVYSAGIMLFELLTGQKPYTADNPIAVAYAHCNRDLPAPSGVAPARRNSAAAIPPYLDALVQSACSRDAARRPADAAALLSNLRLARAALERGVVNDPRLDHEMRRAGVSAPPQDPTPVASVPPFHRWAPRPDMGPVTPSSPDHFAPRVEQYYAEVGRAAEPAVVAPPPRPRPVPRHQPTPQQARQRSRSGSNALRGLLVLVIVVLIAIILGLTAWWLATGRFG